jgi:hypothetical protein
LRDAAVGAWILAVAALSSARGVTPAPGPAAITFTKDVAPVLQQKCQVCHQPDSIGPMPLITYEDAREYADKIKRKVSQRLMPPWHIDRTVGIQEFKNDRSLSDAQIATLVGWVDAGTPLGDPKDMPPPMRFPDPAGWQLAKQFGAPDLVIKSQPYTLAAHTQDKWFRPVTETGLTEPRWVRAIEIKPTTLIGRRIVHHVLASLEQKEAAARRITGLAHSAHDVQTSAGSSWNGRSARPARSSPGRRQADAAGIAHPLGDPHVRDRRGSEGQPGRARDLLLSERHRAGAPHRAPHVRRHPRHAARHPAGETAMSQNYYVLQAPARSRISSRTCTCAAGRCRWRRSIRTAARKC